MPSDASSAAPSPPFSSEGSAHRRLLLLSNSRNPDGDFLVHAAEAIRAHLQGCRAALFIPFAGVSISYDAYTERVRDAFAAWGVQVHGIHDVPDAVAAVQHAQAIVIGGGNTFALLERLQRAGLLSAIRDRVLAGTPYIGWSAGSVIACPTIGTTNDMPIVAPNGLEALGLVDFQVNAHFTDVHPPGFRGETRRERLAEYLALNPHARVVGLPEGSWLRVTGSRVVLHGPHAAPVFGSDGDSLLASGAELST